jgi:hypothetical protein
LRRLEERLDRASAAAERLMAEAAERTDDSPPPSGWQAPESDGGARRDSDLEALLTLARSLRDLVPADLQQRLITALRELLQAVRDLVDWYVERLDRERAEPAQVQDIPIL